MVTAEAVWEALGEVEDPEIPVISVVDLGVVRDVTVEDDRVHVEFTPTFLGCPALEVMRAQMAERIRALGAEPDVEVVLDDSWSTDRITPEGREKLRAGGLRAAGAARGRRSEARAAPERCLPLSVLRLERYRGWTTSSARRRAARSATARAAASPSSSSRRSRPSAYGAKSPHSVKWTPNFGPIAEHCTAAV